MQSELQPTSHDAAPVTRQRQFCPTCDSPEPHLHPAVQFEGEVGICMDPFHRILTPQNTRERIRQTFSKGAVPRLPERIHAVLEHDVVLCGNCDEPMNVAAFGTDGASSDVSYECERCQWHFRIQRSPSFGEAQPGEGRRPVGTSEPVNPDRDPNPNR